MTIADDTVGGLGLGAIPGTVAGLPSASQATLPGRRLLVAYPYQANHPGSQAGAADPHGIAAEATTCTEHQATTLEGEAGGKR